MPKNRIFSMTPETFHFLSTSFQIEVQQLNFRLSYNDVKLFLAIAQSLPNLNSLEKREQPFKPREGEVDGRLL